MMQGFVPWHVGSSESGIKPMSLAWQADSLPLSHRGSSRPFFWCFWHEASLYNSDHHSCFWEMLLFSHPVVSDCDPMDWSTPDLSAPHHVPKFAQVHVHNTGDLSNVVGHNNLSFSFAQFIADFEVEGRFSTKPSNLYFLILSKWEESPCLLVFFFFLLLRKLFTYWESTTYFGWSLLEYLFSLNLFKFNNFHL